MENPRAIRQEHPSTQRSRHLSCLPRSAAHRHRTSSPSFPVNTEPCLALRAPQSPVVSKNTHVLGPREPAWRRSLGEVPLTSHLSASPPLHCCTSPTLRSSCHQLKPNFFVLLPLQIWPQAYNQVPVRRLEELVRFLKNIHNSLLLGCQPCSQFEDPTVKGPRARAGSGSCNGTGPARGAPP